MASFDRFVQQSPTHSHRAAVQAAVETLVAQLPAVGPDHCRWHDGAVAPRRLLVHGLMVKALALETAPVSYAPFSHVLGAAAPTHAPYAGPVRQTDLEYGLGQALTETKAQQAPVASFNDGLQKLLTTIRGVTYGQYMKVHNKFRDKGSKVRADGEMERRLLLNLVPLTNQQSVVLKTALRYYGPNLDRPPRPLVSWFDRVERAVQQQRQAAGLEATRTAFEQWTRSGRAVVPVPVAHLRRLGDCAIERAGAAIARSGETTTASEARTPRPTAPHVYDERYLSMDELAVLAARADLAVGASQLPRMAIDGRFQTVEFRVHFEDVAPLPPETTPAQCLAQGGNYVSAVVGQAVVYMSLLDVRGGRQWFRVTPPGERGVLCECPVPVGSWPCHTTSAAGQPLSAAELRDAGLGHDPTEQSGYYILNGRRVFLSMREDRYEQTFVPRQEGPDQWHLHVELGRGSLGAKGVLPRRPVSATRGVATTPPQRQVVDVVLLPPSAIPTLRHDRGTGPRHRGGGGGATVRSRHRPHHGRARTSSSSSSSAAPRGRTLHGSTRRRGGGGGATQSVRSGGDRADGPVTAWGQKNTNTVFIDSHANAAAQLLEMPEPPATALGVGNVAKPSGGPIGGGGGGAAAGPAPVAAAAAAAGPAACRRPIGGGSGVMLSMGWVAQKLHEMAAPPNGDAGSVAAAPPLQQQHDRLVRFGARLMAPLRLAAVGRVRGRGGRAWSRLTLQAAGRPLPLSTLDASLDTNKVGLQTGPTTPYSSSQAMVPGATHVRACNDGGRAGAAVTGAARQQPPPLPRFVRGELATATIAIVGSATSTTATATATATASSSLDLLQRLADIATVPRDVASPVPSRERRRQNRSLHVAAMAGGGGSGDDQAQPQRCVTRVQIRCPPQTTGAVLADAPQALSHKVVPLSLLLVALGALPVPATEESYMSFLAGHDGVADMGAYWPLVRWDWRTLAPWLVEGPARAIQALGLICGAASRLSADAYHYGDRVVRYLCTDTDALVVARQLGDAARLLLRHHLGLSRADRTAIPLRVMTPSTHVGRLGQVVGAALHGIARTLLAEYLREPVQTHLHTAAIAKARVGDILACLDSSALKSMAGQALQSTGWVRPDAHKGGGGGGGGGTGGGSGGTHAGTAASRSSTASAQLDQVDVTRKGVRLHALSDPLSMTTTLAQTAPSSSSSSQDGGHTLGCESGQGGGGQGGSGSGGPPSKGRYGHAGDLSAAFQARVHTAAQKAGMWIGASGIHCRRPGVGSSLVHTGDPGESPAQQSEHTRSFVSQTTAQSKASNRGIGGHYQYFVAPTHTPQGGDMATRYQLGAATSLSPEIPSGPLGRLEQLLCAVSFPLWALPTPENTALCTEAAPLGQTALHGGTELQAALAACHLVGPSAGGGGGGAPTDAAADAAFETHVDQCVTDVLAYAGTLEHPDPLFLLLGHPSAALRLQIAGRCTAAAPGPGPSVAARTEAAARRCAVARELDSGAMEAPLLGEGEEGEIRPRPVVDGSVSAAAPVATYETSGSYMTVVRGLVHQSLQRPASRLDPEIRKLLSSGPVSTMGSRIRTALRNSVNTAAASRPWVTPQPKRLGRHRRPEAGGHVAERKDPHHHHLGASRHHYHNGTGPPPSPFGLRPAWEAQRPQKHPWRFGGPRQRGRGHGRPRRG